MEKTVNQKAWFLVLPVLVLVAFSAVIPLMTVVNYSVQDTFGDNEFFWAGIEWFDEMLHSDRLWDALGRQMHVLGHHPGHRGAAWHLHRAEHAEEGLLGLGLPVADVAAAADPVQRGGHDLADLRARRHRPAGPYARLRSASTTTTPTMPSTPGPRSS